jgi:hypothetical protein
LQRIFDWYGVSGDITFAHGSGTLFGKPEGTGCANIGAVHREGIYPAFKRWFAMPAPTREVQDRKPPEDLLCLTPQLTEKLKPRQVHEIAAELGRERWLQSHKVLVSQPLAERRQALRRDWGKLLGEVAPAADPKVTSSRQEKLGDVTVERVALEVEPGIVVPLLLLVPPRAGGARLPVVIGVAEHGKQAFFKERADVIAELLKGGVAVCLPDVRGTGETRPDGDHRGPPAGTYKGVQASSYGTMLACEDLMLGRTLLGDRLRDLRSVLRWLKTRADLDASRVALWGDSFAPVNLPDAILHVPWDAEKVPAQSEPLGGLLALFGALYEDGVVAVHVQGGLASWQTLLGSASCHVARDVLVPGALTAGELGDVAAGLAPRPVRFVGLVDGQNRRASQQVVTAGLEPTLRVYLKEGVKDRLVIDGKESTAAWVLAHLKK